MDSKCNGCQGCWYPMSVCAYGAISFDTVSNTATIDATKCIGWAECAQLNGGQTACEASCPDPAGLVGTVLAIVRG